MASCGHDWIPVLVSLCSSGNYFARIITDFLRWMPQYKAYLFQCPAMMTNLASSVKKIEMLHCVFLLLEENNAVPLYKMKLLPQSFPI